MSMTCASNRKRPESLTIEEKYRVTEVLGHRQSRIDLQRISCSLCVSHSNHAWNDEPGMDYETEPEDFASERNL